MREPLGSLDARLESEPKAGEILKYAPQASGCMPIQADVLIPDQLFAVDLSPDLSHPLSPVWCLKAALNSISYQQLGR